MIGKNSMRAQMLGSLLLFAVLETCHVSAQTSLVGIWKEGDKFSYAIEDQYTLGSAGNATLSQSLKLDTEWQVKSVSKDGIADIAVQIERVRFTAEQKGIPADWDQLSFDSKTPGDSQSKGVMSTFRALSSFVGKQVLIRISEKRELLKFELAEPLALHLDKNPITLELAGFYGHTFTSIGMQRRITNWLIASPSKPVSIGETWRAEQGTLYEDFLVCADTYTLRGPTQWDGQTFTKIDIKTELTLPDNDQGERATKIAKQSGGTGVVYLDERTGRIVDATLNHQFAESENSQASINTTITAKLLNSPK
jgi:hypothetical protein